MEKTIREYAIQAIRDEAKAVLDLIPQIDFDAFEQAVDLMFH